MSTQIIGMPSQPDKGGSLLYLDNVSKSFDGFKAINALSLVIGKGEMRAIIGPNGAGKTTMMDIITGKTRPDTGEVFFRGSVDLTRHDEAEIANLGIGRKFQKPTVFENHTVEDNLLRVVPDEFLRDAHHWLILHGRYTCLARKPRCEACPIADQCPSRPLFEAAHATAASATTASASTAWTSQFEVGQEITIPLKNADGGYICSAVSCIYSVRTHACVGGGSSNDGWNACALRLVWLQFADVSSIRIT
mgnify:CR=1 FL=1